jgi:ABC-type multidrug transport system ATPase subunit
MLEIKDLSKHYGKKKALDAFSCSFDNGICGLLGPNGAGKSTLMKLISDNLTRETGEIFFEGKEILRLGATFRSILGYMPQQQGMYEGMTAYAFLFYIANLKGIPRNEAKKQIDNLLEVVNLSGVSHRKLRTFSGGMRQRVMLAQALMGNTKVVVLDEPTVGLDPQERIKLCKHLGELSSDKIVLWSTHIVKEIEEIANTIAIMKNGHLITHDSVNGILSTTHAASLEDAYLIYMGEADERV